MNILSYYAVMVNTAIHETNDVYENNLLEMFCIFKEYHTKVIKVKRDNYLTKNNLPLLMTSPGMGGGG